MVSSALAPLPISGVRLAVVCAGIKYPDRRDLVLIALDEGTRCAAVFMRNAFCAAPVIVAREHLGLADPRFLVINSGNANAGMGRRGLNDARATCAAVASLMGCSVEGVLPFSTGVIGEALPVDRLIGALPDAKAALDSEGWGNAALGIMTTDTRPKFASRRVDIDGNVFTVTGIAKGAGMIRPDMATMLAFIATDAAVDRTSLQLCLDSVVRESFNAISVDGDTSTNDACVLLATGKSGARFDHAGAAFSHFVDTVQEICIELAQAIVRDGEGATKFVTVQVAGGADTQECREVADTIAHSPLVKTALFASDPNWGRILAAVGRAGIQDLVVERVTINLDEVCVVRNGERAEGYDEASGQSVMERDQITIRVELGRGPAEASIWTTDLSLDYVRINAEYRS